MENSKWMEASARFASVEEGDIATLLSNRDSLNAIKASINAVGVYSSIYLKRVSLQVFLSRLVCSLREYNIIIKQLLDSLLY